MFAPRIAAAWLLTLLAATPSVGAAELHIWVRAFIPAGTPAEAAGRCFKTDGRSFDASVSSSSRLVTEFLLVTSGATVSTRQAGERPYFRAGETVRLDCKSKVILERKTVDVAGLKLGKPAMADGIVQIVAGASVANPLTPPVLSPKIDYDATFTWITTARTLKARFTVGRFPAFEAYAQLSGGNVVQLLAVDPDTNASPFALYDFGVGASSRVFEVTKQL